MNISMKLVYQYMAILFTFSPTPNHRHPLQVENCDSNSRLVVDEEDNGKSGLKVLRHETMVYLAPSCLQTKTRADFAHCGFSISHTFIALTGKLGSIPLIPV